MTGAPRFLPVGRPGRCTKPELAARLVTFDELDQATGAELERHATTCPICGPALRLLKRTDQWIDRRGPAPSSCPAPEELFDFGRGPGAQPLLETQRRVIGLHLESCAACRADVETLRRHPPLPLDLSALPVELDNDLELPRPRRSAWTFGLRSALAAAAALLFYLGWRQWGAAGSAGAAQSGNHSTEVAQALPSAGDGAGGAPERAASDAAALEFPKPELLRSLGSSGLMFPRGRVLASAQGTPRFALTFELTPVERARSYRIEVARNDGTAFGPTVRVFRLESPTPACALDVELARALAPGNYTWTAWADIDGLEHEIGRRDFELVSDEELEAQLDLLQSRAGADAPQAVLNLLHQHEFIGDARAFARSLPDSPKRAAYLEAWSQR